MSATLDALIPRVIAHIVGLVRLEEVLRSQLITLPQETLQKEEAWPSHSRSRKRLHVQTLETTLEHYTVYGVMNQTTMIRQLDSEMEKPSLLLPDLLLLTIYYTCGLQED